MGVSISLASVLEALTGERPAGWDQTISQTVVDSRRAEPGALFVALTGEKADGHDYVEEAFARGAVAAIVEHPLAFSGLTLDVPRIVPPRSMIPEVLTRSSTVVSLSKKPFQPLRIPTTS